MDILNGLFCVTGLRCLTTHKKESIWWEILCWQFAKHSFSLVGILYVAMCFIKVLKRKTYFKRGLLQDYNIFYILIQVTRTIKGEEINC